MDSNVSVAVEAAFEATLSNLQKFITRGDRALAGNIDNSFKIN